MPSGTSPSRNTTCLLANRLIEWGCSAWRSARDRNVPNTESSRSGHLLHIIVHLYPGLFSGHQVGNSPEGQPCIIWRSLVRWVPTSPEDAFCEPIDRSG